MITRIELLEFINTKALWTVKKKGKLLTVNIILILVEFLNDRFVTPKWKICYSSQQMSGKFLRQPQSIFQSVREYRALFVWVCLRVTVCGQQQPKCGRAIRLVHSPSICKPHSSSKPTDKNLTELGEENCKTDSNNVSATIQNQAYVHMNSPLPHTHTQTLTTTVTS